MYDAVVAGQQRAHRCGCVEPHGSKSSPLPACKNILSPWLLLSMNAIQAHLLSLHFFYNRVTNNALQGSTGVSSCSEISGPELPGNDLLLTKHARGILSVHGVSAML